MFAGIRRGRPGHFLRFGKGHPEQQGYWRPRYEETVRISRQEASHQIREGLARAIDRRAPADVTSGHAQRWVDIERLRDDQALHPTRAPPDRRLLGGAPAPLVGR